MRTSLRFAAMLLLVVYIPMHAQTLLRGKVVDSLTNKPIAFVNITLQDGIHGTTSDIEGNFKLHTPAGYGGWIIISHIGYKKLRLPLSTFNSPPTIKLTPSATMLSEFMVYSGENPADRIIRRVIEHRDQNDPAKLKSYRYTSYTKLLMTTTEPSRRLDSLLQVWTNLPDSVKLTKYQKSLVNFNSVVDASHLFLSESVTEKQVINPDKQKEKLLAFQVSGYKSLVFSSVATDFQSFSFYPENIELLGKSFLNPISKGTFNRYDFHLVDTAFYQADTVYIIQFSPKEKKFFNGMEGLISISVDGYAIKNVTARAADTLAMVGVRFQQDYEKFDGHWFPVQLNTDFEFSNINVGERNIVAHHISYFSDITINPTLNPAVFGDIVRELTPVHKDVNATLLDKYRIRPLEEKETSTYTYMDSVMRKLGWLDKTFEALMTGAVPVNRFEIPINRLVAFNRYEKVRVGIGLYTNTEFSKVFQAGGYYGYGFGDKASKYGGGVKFNFNANKDLYLRLTYARDISETGAVHIDRDGPRPGSEWFRRWQAEQYDRYTNYKTEFGARLAQNIHGSVSVSYQHIAPTYNYALMFEGEPRAVFDIAEAGIAVRYIHQENYMSLRGKKIFISQKFPIITFSAIQSLDVFNTTGLTYTLYDFSIKHQHQFRALGKSTVMLTGGLVRGIAPYGKLFNGRGALTTDFFVEDFFQTMDLYEFTASRYAAVFFHHNFGNVLVNKRYVKPELLIYQNAAIGSLDHADIHQGVLLLSPDKGYFESGIGLDNLIRIPYFGIGYFTGGGSVFYRYGPYRFADQHDNFVYRISIGFVF